MITQKKFGRKKNLRFIMAEYFRITFETATDKNKDGFISVEANNEKDVRSYAERHYKNRLITIYPEGIFAEAERNYPAGCLEQISLIRNSN